MLLRACSARVFCDTLDAEELEPPDTPCLSYDSWMNDTANRLWSIPLRRVHLPGAHNSAAFQLNRVALAPAGGAHPDWVGWLNSHSSRVTAGVSGLAAPWADCQGESVLAQLQHGVRYLDLRAVWVDGAEQRRALGLPDGGADWLVTHTLLGGRIEDVFVQVASFLATHPREVVLLDLQHVKAAPSVKAHMDLLGAVQKHLAPFMAPPSLGRDVTYGALISGGHAAIVFYPLHTAEADFPGAGVGSFAQRIGCWHRGGGVLASPWPKVGTLEGLLSKLGPLCEAAGDATGVVTPDMPMVAAGLLGLPGPKSLRQLADVVTPHVQAFCASHPWRAPCIIMVDFVSDSSIVRSLLSTYYASLPLLPRGLPPSAAHPPATHGGSGHPPWRFPADKSLFAANGSDLLFWDHGTEQRRDKPAARLAGGGGGRSGGGSPRAGQRPQPWPPVEEATDAAPS